MGKADSDIKLLNIYAIALVKKGDYIKAFEQFEKSLILNPKDNITLSSYGNALTIHGDFEKANEMYERSLNIEPDQVMTMNKYANALISMGNYNKAYEIFERALIIEYNQVILNNYINALVTKGHYNKAFSLFEELLKNEPNSVNLLNSYANILLANNSSDRAAEIFERSIKIDPSQVRIINSYATILANRGDYSKAFELLNMALSLEPENPYVLAGYAVILLNLNQFTESIEKFKLSLKYNPDNILTLTNYAKALTQNEEFEKAIEMYKRVMVLDKDDYIAPFLCAGIYEKLHKYEKAIDTLEKINLLKMKKSFGNFVCVILGRLHYLLKQESRGNEFFNQAIENSEKKDIEKLRIARSILSVNPYDNKAIELLQEISGDSDLHTQVTKMLTLNLEPKSYFSYFTKNQENEYQDIQLIYRGIYHKIKNEIGILQIQTNSILKKIQSKELQEISENIQQLNIDIQKRRDAVTNEISKIPTTQYEQILSIISQTAHEISDFVNNELAAIKLQTKRILKHTQNEQMVQNKILRFIKQIEFTENALNDLKSINEGIKLYYEIFDVNELFENWRHIYNFQNATIKLYVNNGDSKFNGDKAKIKSFLSELIENSLKHNTENHNLVIKISSQDITDLPNYLTGLNKAFRKKYLQIIFSDNGKGVPIDKKEWIFLPLTTTNTDTGSGLGLFIIKRILNEMKGYIIERGAHGAKFEIYLPYLEEE